MMTTDERIAFRLPRRLKKKVEKLAAAQDRTPSYIVRDILAEYFEQLEITQAAPEPAPEPAAA